MPPRAYIFNPICCTIILMNPVRHLREKAGITQGALAERAGTSQPTIAAYEGGRRSPTLRTMQRLAAAAGFDMVVDFVPPLTREDRRSLVLHRAIAAKLRGDPDRTIRRARRNLRTMRDRNPNASALLNDWARLLDLPVSHVDRVLTDPAPHARELRAVTPFAGVLTAEERTEVYRHFRRSEERAA